MTDRWASSRGADPSREGTAGESLMEEDVTGVHILDRLLVSGEGGKAPVSNVKDLLEMVGISCDKKGGTGSTDTDPDLTSGKEGDQVKMGPRARMGSLPNTHPGEGGATSESIFEGIVPGLVMVGEDPAGRETGERSDKNRKFMRKVGETSGTVGNLAIAVAEESVGPFPVVRVGYSGI